MLLRRDLNTARYHGAGEIGVNWEQLSQAAVTRKVAVKGSKAPTPSETVNLGTPSALRLRVMRCRTSRRSDSEKPSIPNFAAAYGARPVGIIRHDVG
jgi:hypothetical protein